MQSRTQNNQSFIKYSIIFVSFASYWIHVWSCSWSRVSFLSSNGGLSATPLSNSSSAQQQDVVFVEFENATANASLFKGGKYRSIQIVTSVEMCCHSNEYWKLVPKEDPLGLLPLENAVLNRPFTNYTGLTAVLRNIDGSSTLVTQQVYDMYNITFSIINNTCGALMGEGYGAKDVLQVQQKGSVSIRMTLIGFSDTTYTRLIRLQSNWVTLMAVQTESMHLQGHPLWDTSVNWRDALQIRSIHCSQNLFEMVFITVHFTDSQLVEQRVHPAAYTHPNFTFGFDVPANVQNSMQQSPRNASIYYGVATGSSTIKVRTQKCPWLHCAASTYMQCFEHLMLTD